MLYKIIKHKIMLYKSRILRLGILVPLLGILLIACENKPGKSSAETATANADASKLPVDIIVAQEKLLNHEEAIVGTMMSNREVSIVSEIPQKITKVAFKDGGYVTQGAVLYTLNDADIKSRLKQVAAELELAKLNKERMSNLLKTETVRQQEYDEAFTRFRSLVAQQDLLRVELAKTIIRAPFSGKIGIFESTSWCLC
jgi:Multidrug resistance efflux pump